MRQARLSSDNALACRVGAAFALAAGSLIPVVPASAQTVTVTLAGAPLMPGFSANTAITDGTSAYLGYEGNISGQDSAHALTAGVRMSWWLIASIELDDRGRIIKFGCTKGFAGAEASL